MKSLKIQNLIAILGFAVVLLSIIWGIAGMIDRNRSIESSQLGWAIDFSPDSLQRDLRITLACFLGALSLWSVRGAKAALVLALVLFLGIECVTWLTVSRSFSDRTEGVYHLLAGVLIVIGAILWARKMNYLLIAMLAPVYILIEGLLWFASTVRMKALLAVETLQPPTTLNNVLYGANWWHLVIMALAMLMVLWETGCIWTQHFRTLHLEKEQNAIPRSGANQRG